MAIRYEGGPVGPDPMSGPTLCVCYGVGGLYGLLPPRQPSTGSPGLGTTPLSPLLTKLYPYDCAMPPRFSALRSVRPRLRVRGKRRKTCGLAGPEPRSFLHE